ncbi:hypothetical protein Tco_1281898 [Tanacetum coccineum]
MMVENKCCGEMMIDNHWMDKLLKEVLKIDCLCIVETDKVIHTVKTDIVKLVVDIESFGMNFDEFDKETGSSDGLQPKQADLSCIHALNELHLHEIHVVSSKHEVDQCRKTQRSLGVVPAVPDISGGRPIDYAPVFVFLWGRLYLREKEEVGDTWFGEKTCNNDKNLSEIQLEHEKEDELVAVVVKVVHELDCMMVVKEIENELFEEVELEWWFEQDIDDERGEDEEDGGGDEV